MAYHRNHANISYYRSSGLQEYVDSATAHRLLADDGHEWRCASCHKEKGEGQCTVAGNHLMALYEVERETADDNTRKGAAESSTSLTFADMERNAGITKGWPGYPPEMRLVNRTRRRIRSWGAASLRNRAVTIIPRGSLPGNRRANIIVPA
jgi:hypothetical protein